jgi:hypothetical protein
VFSLAGNEFRHFEGFRSSVAFSWVLLELATRF